MRKLITPAPPIRSKADWDDLYLLLVVGQTGSLRKAAEIVGQAAPTIGRRLEVLEARLGVQLLVRGATGVTLTEEGELAADRALSMQRNVSELEDLFAKQDREVAGEVTVSCGEALAAPFLAPRLVELTRPHPKLHVRLVTEMPIKEPGSGASDVSIQYFSAKNMESVGIRLGTMHYCLFGSEAYFDVYGRPEAAIDQVLDKHRVILHSAYRSSDPGLSERAGHIHSLANFTTTTDSSAVMVEMVANGAGLAMMPSYASLFDERLIMVDSPPLAPVPFWLVFRETMRDAPRVQVVVDWIRSVFDRALNPWFREEFVPPRDFGGADIPRNATRH
jgi:DNA-binding transcriptional LysR family regulator